MNRKILTIAVLLNGVVALNAQSVFAPAITRGVEADPAIAASHARGLAEVAEIKAENTLDGPEAEFEHLWNSRADEPNKWSAGVSQEFSMPGVYAARRHSAESTAAANAAEHRLMQLNRALVIKLAIVDLINAHSRLNLYKDIRSNLDRINDLTERAYRTGDATVLDYRKLQLAVLDSDNTLSAIRAEIEQLTATLTSLSVSPEDFTPDMLAAYPVMEIREQNLTPLEVSASARRRQALDRAAVARRSGLPAISLGYRHAFEEGTHFNGLAVSLKLPVWSRKHRVEAAEAEAAAVAFDAAAEQIEFKAESEALLRQATVNAVTIEKYADLTSDNSYLGLLQKAFDAGQLQIIDYLTEVNMFTAARINYLDLQYRQALTLTRLGRYNSIDF